MTKPRLLIVDACTVIELHEIGLWAAVASNFEVTVTETVRDEAGHYLKDDEKIPIELGTEVQVVAVSAKESADFRARFSVGYIADLHPGETDSLVLLFQTQDSIICSSDAIVFKVLGALGEGD